MAFDNNLIIPTLCAMILIIVINYFQSNKLAVINICDPASLFINLKLFKLKDGRQVQYHDYFDIIPLMSDSQFMEDFRMSKTIFELLHSKLIQTAAFSYAGVGKPPINTRKCLLIGIWVLATPDSYRSISKRFAISKSSVVTCVRRVIRGLISDVCQHAIKLPTNENQRAAIAREFEECAKMKKVLGAIDGCHIEIEAPKEDKEVYFDRKKDYSIVLQGLCDANLFFLNVDVRWPGSVHDARAFRTSDLYPIGKETCRNDYYFIGDSAYPLKSWVMRPYKRTGLLDARKKLFNKTLSKTRQVIERAFGRLKNKFRRLYYLHMLSIQDAVQAIVACCILHNICLANEEYARILIFGENEEEDDVADFINNIEEDPNNKRQRLVNEIWQLYHPE